MLRQAEERSTNVLTVMGFITLKECVEIATIKRAETKRLQSANILLDRSMLGECVKPAI